MIMLTAAPSSALDDLTRGNNELFAGIGTGTAVEFFSGTSTGTALPTSAQVYFSSVVGAAETITVKAAEGPAPT